LQRAHHKRQANEGAGDDDADRRVGDLDAQRFQNAADPAVAGVQRGERDAGHRRRQGERQVDDGVEQAPAGKAVAHQHPGHQRAEEQVDAGAGERGAEAQFERRAHPRCGDDRPEAVPSQAGGLDEQARQRDQHQQAEVAQREAQRQSEAGQDGASSRGRYRVHGERRHRLMP
jgi:hypothetical protein